MSAPIAIEVERLERMRATLRVLDALLVTQSDDQFGSELKLVGALRRLHNEVSAWLVELEEPGRAA